MERMNCILIEDDILEILDAVHEQIQKNLVCCKCPTPCDKTTRCALAMKNLQTDIHMFVDAYRKHNKIEETEEEDTPKEE